MSSMSRGILGLVSLFLALGLARTSTVQAADPGLVGWWKFDEGSGAVVHDASPNANHGTLNGPQWAPGQIGGALRFVGATDYVEMPDSPSLDVTDTITIAVWIFREVDTGGYERLVAKSDASLYDYWLQISNTDTIGGGIRDAANAVHHIDTIAGPALPLNQWTHLALVYDGVNLLGYINGQAVKSVNIGPFKLMISTRALWIRRLQNYYSFQGFIDEACIYRRALAPAEIQEVMQGLREPALAGSPRPADQAADVPRDAALGWSAGEFARTHDVYLGTVFADVNTAARNAARGVLVSRDQAGTTYDPPGDLAFDTTYYWRIDEVNAAPAATVFRGTVWSFTTEPYGYPIAKIAATASSSQPGAGPEKTIDGSGLTGDRHSTAGGTMWLSTGVGPNWIQYEFDRLYKLYDLTVWNCNQTMEPFLGFGAKEVQVEYSTDGITWTTLADVPLFARAPGLANYAANTTARFGGVDARLVKLTIQSNWGGLSAVTGLSEVRFTYIPVQARGPQPATATTGIALDPTLDWRPGRLATSHQVYFGTDPNAVAAGAVPVKTVAGHTFAPGSLNYGTTYYWKVDEVNAGTYPGEVWNFTTQEFATIDDFESYGTEEGGCVFQVWTDGFTNGTASVVGLYPDAINGTFCSTAVFHGGRQSMPVEYNNLNTPFYSEAVRTFDTPQNWMGRGADTLALWVQGRPAVFADKGNNAYTVSASGTGIQGNADQFRFVYKQLTGNGSITMRVDSLVNTNAWARAGGMIRGGLNAGSRNAMMEVTAGSGVPFQWRLADSGTTSSDNTGSTGLVAPQWVRLTRTGDNFKGERSTDGKTWTQQGTEMTIAMPNPVYIGMAVTSQNANATTVAEISNVSTTGAVTGQWQVLAIGAEMPGNDPASMYVVVEDKAGKKKVVNPNPAACTTAAWTQWRIPFSDLTSAGVSLAAVKKLTLGVGDPASPKPGAAGLLYFDDIGCGHPAQ